MYLRKLRLQRAWSQEQLAEMAGLSTRTVQRVEQGHPASLETLKALAAVFECDVSELAEQINHAKAETPSPLASNPSPEKENTMQVSQFPTPSSNAAFDTKERESEKLSLEEREVMYQVKKLSGFYRHAVEYAFIICLLGGINALVSPKYWWFLWVAFGWGIGLVSHGLSQYCSFKNYYLLSSNAATHTSRLKKWA